MLPEPVLPTDVLYTRAAPIRAVRGTEMNIFAQAVARLELAANESGTPVAVVGGLAAIRHGVLVTTIDIDIVVARDGMSDFLQAVQRHGLTVKRDSTEGWHLLEFRYGAEAVGIEIVPEGGRTPRDPVDAPLVPHPRELGVVAGLDYASFASWVALKLVANRDKDRYHVVEALKLATPDQIAACVVQLRTMPPRYLIEFERLVRDAEDEKLLG